MGIADRDYMRERAQDRVRKNNGVFRPGTKFGNPYRKRQITLLAVFLSLLAGAIYAEKYGWGGPPLMASNPSRKAALSSQQPQPQSQPTLTPPVHTDELPVGMQAFPASGTTQWFRQINPQQTLGVLRIMDTSGMSGNKVVRIRDAFQAPVAQVYIHDEEGAVLQLPLGHYEMTIAMGGPWYGPEQQFGPTARYFQTMGVDVIQGEMSLRILPQNQGGQPMNPISSGKF